MKAAARNGLIAALAVAAVAGWIFAFAGINPLYAFSPVRTVVYYGYDSNLGVVPCIAATGEETPSIKIYTENTYGPDAVVDFTLSARNADVSADAASGFDPSASKRVTVFEGTQYTTETFYVRPHQDVNDLSLTLTAKAVNPANAQLTYTLPFSNTVVFFENEAGEYCR